MQQSDKSDHSYEWCIRYGVCSLLLQSSERNEVTLIKLKME